MKTFHTFRSYGINSFENRIKSEINENTNTISVQHVRPYKEANTRCFAGLNQSGPECEQDFS